MRAGFRRFSAWHPAKIRPKGSKKFGLEDWGKFIGDVPSATAILDRFLHRAEVLQIAGQSYRLASREKPSKETKAPTGS